MERKSEKDREEIEYYKKIAEQTGNLYLRETEALSKVIYRLEQTETALRESEQKLRNIIEHTNEMFYLHDINHHFIYVSPKCIDFFGYTPEQLKVRWMELMTDNPINRDGYEITQKAIETGEKQKPYILEGRKRNGKTIVLEIDESPVKDQHGKVIFISGAARDITNRKRAEEEKERLESQLRQALKMEAIGKVAGGIAHDINNILSIILGNTELAIRDSSDSNPTKQNLKAVIKACGRAKDIVCQLLSFSRKSEIQLRPLNIDSVIKDSLKLVRSSIPSNIEIRQDIDEGIRPILGDPTQINQILINLSTNAADAIGDKDGVLSVTLENVQLVRKDAALDLEPGRYVKMTVSDTGVGIPLDTVDRIFDPYFTTKEVGKGTGIGLTVVHGILETHKGRIRTTSQPGKGAIFELFFRAVEATPEIDVPTDERLPLGSETILLVDDEEAIVELNQSILERLGYQVKGTPDPIEALEIFRAGPSQFDLIITDMTMPKMMGDQLALKIMTIQPDIPIIISSGYSERISEDSAIDKGIKAFIMKPLDVRKLAETVRTVLDSTKG